LLIPSRPPICLHLGFALGQQPSGSSYLNSCLDSRPSHASPCDWCDLKLNVTRPVTVLLHSAACATEALHRRDAEQVRRELRRAGCQPGGDGDIPGEFWDGTQMLPQASRTATRQRGTGAPAAMGNRGSRLGSESSTVVVMAPMEGGLVAGRPPLAQRVGC
jgi:hypothetical protein